MIALQIRGVGALIKGLNKRADMSGVKKTIVVNTSKMQKSAQRYAPVDTGNLKRSINMSILENGLTGQVRAEADYSPYVEWGTRYMSAQPFMRPAFHEQEKKFISDLKRLMK